MVKHNVRKIDDVGQVINEYYLDSSTIEKAVSKDKKPEEILK